MFETNLKFIYVYKITYETENIGLFQLLHIFVTRTKNGFFTSWLSLEFRCLLNNLYAFKALYYHKMATFYIFANSGMQFFLISVLLIMKFIVVSSLLFTSIVWEY